MLTPKEFQEIWDTYTDNQRINFLIENKGDIPLYVIQIDNDEVFLGFDGEIDKDDPISPTFDDFGDELLETLFNTINLSAEFV